MPVWQQDSTLPDLRQHSAIGRFVRRIFAKLGVALVALDQQGARDLEQVRRTRRRVPLLMHDMPALHVLASARAASRLGGVFAEAGVFMGGSARLICEAKGAAPLHLFDVFETVRSQDRSLLSGAEMTLDAHFGPVHSTRAQVEQLLARYEGVHLHPGLFPDTASTVADERFSFVHLDMDLAQSTREALEFFYPRLVPGGILLGDDYNLPEVREAFEAFFSASQCTFVPLPWNQVMVVANS